MLLTRHVASVLELDVLLAMRGAGTAMAAGELARELRLNDSACAAALDKFATDGFLTCADGAYSYEPKPPKLAAAVNALAEAYASRRVSVIRFIYRRPSEGVSAFADAFKIRRDD